MWIPTPSSCVDFIVSVFLFSLHIYKNRYFLNNTTRKVGLQVRCKNHIVRFLPGKYSHTGLWFFCTIKVKLHIMLSMILTLMYLIFPLYIGAIEQPNLDQDHGKRRVV